MNKKFNILTAAVLIVSSLAVFFTSCETDNPRPDFIVMDATTLELVSGGGQTDFTEATLENEIEVLVKDMDGIAYEGEVITFTVLEGSVSVASATTDANGKASVIWTLGETEGTQILTITGTSTLTGEPIFATATAEYKPVIGDFKYGGVIFYIDETEKSGLVCAVTDQSTDADWGCSVTDITGADGTAIGTGAQNTLDIELDCPTAGTAADLCTNLALNTYEDWFLPSEDELYEMYLNKATIETTTLANSGTAFGLYYWSSTELSDVNARAIAFDDGFKTSEPKTSTTPNARAIRAF